MRKNAIERAAMAWPVLAAKVSNLSVNG